MKPVNSQLDDLSDMKSEAITACVAMTIVPSALDMKTAVNSSRQISKIMDCAHTNSIKLPHT